MELEEFKNSFDFTGRTVVITGGAGVLGGEIACALNRCNANIVIIDRNLELAKKLLHRLDTSCGQAMVVHGDVLKKETLEEAAQQVTERFGGIDALINAAGGNHPDATTSAERTFFDLPESGLDFVVDLNLKGTIITCQAFGKFMAEQKQGVILNISSMNAFRPLTRIPAYSAAKAGVSNFTQWLAVYMAQEFSPEIRVNAIAPGFFLTEQNRYLLIDEKGGNLTERGKKIIEHTPMGRFGEPGDLIGAALWLLSSAAAFVTGVVIPIDGGFSAYSGI
ncbi:MAG: SDR family oxidoreductase [Calditrichaeota bacterium]|nr:SDR family oxidoreductase [Calditrichota bacterium]